MEKLLFISLSLLLTFCNGTSKSPQQSMESPQEQDLKAQGTQQMKVKQGIQGRVLWESGNRMPSPDAPQTSGKRGVARTLYIYELTNGTQATTQEGVFHTNIQTKLVTQVVTDANGNFAVSLKPGKYSLFTKEEKGLYANLFDGENNVFPVEVKEGQVTTVEFLINYNASY
ncbi:carboxypeptidase-like regulatory domain-containing protein [Pontibacter ruber]|uniref:Carboxypeptidase-like regulatory domain-containing protein n=1 Tax=Pontibacter ruber TaxID=1343895 RepID=A0ABW5CZQ9_9BACT|nr:carboxypeptidase-like regulatory domain-containing protein [Pontibacter ruber]